MDHFDYIIAGAGASGLTLAYLLSKEENRNPRILILDHSDKSLNDRTWCFWEQNENLFESLVCKHWSLVEFHGPGLDTDFDIRPYQYKMIRGADFYQFIKSALSEHENITWQQESVISLDKNIVVTNRGSYQADYIFNSTKSLKDFDIPTKYHQLLQHFKGRFIRTKTPSFDPEKFTYMDFRVNQQNDCRFGYVLPFNSNEALVEYTLFSANTLSQEEYDIGLDEYIDQHLQITDYEILETEFGVIPMTDFPFPKKEGKHIINIGTSGGHTKASTGYTFLRTQKIVQQIAKNLANNTDPLKKLPFQNQRFKRYDSTLLHVLATKNRSGAKVFTDLFRKNGPHAIFRFLDEETHLGEELKIMNSTPILTFAKAFIERLGI